TRSTVEGAGEFSSSARGRTLRFAVGCDLVECALHVSAQLHVCDRGWLVALGLEPLLYVDRSLAAGSEHGLHVGLRVLVVLDLCECGGRVLLQAGFACTLKLCRALDLASYSLDGLDGVHRFHGEVE